MEKKNEDIFQDKGITSYISWYGAGIHRCVNLVRPINGTLNILYSIVCKSYLNKIGVSSKDGV